MSLLFFLRKICYLCHIFSVLQFPQKPAVELFYIFFPLPDSPALEPVDTNMFGPVVFITVTDKQAADLLPHACQSWFINTLTASLTPYGNKRLTHPTSLILINISISQSQRTSFLSSIRTKRIALNHSQACFYREPVFLKTLWINWEWYHMLKRCFSSQKFNQRKACMSH